MHYLILLHLNVSKIYHIQHFHPSIYANEYTYHVQVASLIVAFQYYYLL